MFYIEFFSANANSIGVNRDPSIGHWQSEAELDAVIRHVETVATSLARLGTIEVPLRRYTVEDSWVEMALFTLPTGTRDFDICVSCGVGSNRRVVYWDRFQVHH